MLFCYPSRFTTQSNAVMMLSKKEVVQQPSSRFIRIKCLECEHEQIIFGSASTEVKCVECERVLAKPSGGKAKLEPIARELEILP